jgi:hypothetical protein
MPLTLLINNRKEYQMGVKDIEEKNTAIISPESYTIDTISLI